MNDDLLTIASDAITHARKIGADAAEVSVTEGRSTEVEIREGKTERMEGAEGRRITLNLFSGKSCASISGNLLTKEAIHELAGKALAMARLAPANPYAGVAEPEFLATRFPDLDLVSEQLPDAASLQRMAQETEQAALSVPGVSKSGGASASCGDRTAAIAISNGFARAQRRTGISFSVSAITGEGTGMERDYDFSSAIHLADLRSPQAVGLEAGRRTARRINSRKIKSQAVPIVFDQRVAPSLIGHLLGAISGSAIARGTSFLKDNLGQQIFSEGVTIVEDPFIPRGLGSRAYDGDGLARVKRNIVDYGVLTTWLLDLRSARQLGLRPTGHGSGTSNVYLKPGNASREDLLRDIQQGLYVTEMIGSSINMVTGDYSRGASGFWIENGELTYPVSEITIAGNLRDMFLNVTPANDLEFRTSVNAPTCRVEGLTIAGH
ncbi:MAG TPA: metallopeptidase TldD-related protein [Aestuariivirga sp.]|nr:metallopeptidase TldD-related protein [Aestuariivirga sp.]